MDPLPALREDQPTGHLPLELVEPWLVHQVPHGVEHRERVRSTWHRGDDRAEDPCTVDVEHGRADSRADPTCCLLGVSAVNMAVPNDS
jgi:hypothetical protein